MTKIKERFGYSLVPYEDKIKNEVLLSIDNSVHHLKITEVLKLRNILTRVYEEMSN